MEIQAGLRVPPKGITMFENPIMHRTMLAEISKGSILGICECLIQEMASPSVLVRLYGSWNTSAEVGLDSLERAWGVP